MTTAPAAKTPTLLSALRWQKRPLITIAPAAADPRLQKQRARYRQYLDAAQERDMVFISLWPGGGQMDDAPLSSSQSDAMRRYFGLGDGSTPFIVLLVGKDGGVKMRSADVVEMDVCFRTIDAMPMRQQEMRAANRLE